jgi:steroid 5-alpha reductase family enzyme
MLPVLLAAFAVALSLLMMAAWLVERRTGNAGWVDVIWSFGVGAFGVMGALAPISDSPTTARQGIVAVLVAVWSLRLGLHIARRTRNGGDDPRYRHLQQQWGAAFPRRLFWFLQVQAAAALVLVLCLFVAAHNPGRLGLSDALGIVILGFAVGGEALADRQLARFRADTANRNRICNIGLWGRSRHPNYFFEWLAWLAYLPISINLSGHYPVGWLVIAAPLMMYWLLAHVSGIPPLEAHMLRSRGKAFEAYQARVNAFWPALLANSVPPQSNRRAS